LQEEADLFLISTTPSQRAADPPRIPRVFLDVQISPAAHSWEIQRNYSRDALMKIKKLNMWEDVTNLL